MHLEWFKRLIRIERFWISDTSKLFLKSSNQGLCRIFENNYGHILNIIFKRKSRLIHDLYVRLKFNPIDRRTVRPGEQFLHQNRPNIRNNRKNSDSLNTQSNPRFEIRFYETTWIFGYFSRWRMRPKVPQILLKITFLGY